MTRPIRRIAPAVALIVMLPTVAAAYPSGAVRVGGRHPADARFIVAPRALHPGPVSAERRSIDPGRLRSIAPRPAVRPQPSPSPLNGPLQLRRMAVEPPTAPDEDPG